MYNPYTIGMPPQMGVGAQYGQMSYNPMQQPMMQYQQQNAQQGEMMYIARVPTLSDFDSISAQPNQDVLIIAQNEPYIAFKKGGAGLQSTEIYEIKRCEPKKVKSDYITRDEFNAFMEQLTAPKKEGNAE